MGELLESVIRWWRSEKQGNLKGYRPTKRPMAQNPEVTPLIDDSDDVELTVLPPTNNPIKEEGEEEECRICFMPDDPEDFCMPCSCKVPVHLGCLERWCKEKGSPRCEICHADYKLDTTRQQSIKTALDAHAARHRAPPRSALELLISGNDPGNEFSRVLQSLRNAQRGLRANEPEEEEEFLRQAQTRRLLVFAVMIVMFIIFFHIVGTVMLSDSHRNHEHSAAAVLKNNTLHSNSTGVDAYDMHRENNTVMGRFFRMMLFFYVVRMLFSRPPPPDRRGLYL